MNPPAEVPCPECMGKCCRDMDYGHRRTHMDAECYEHVCDHCEDGTKYVPPPDYAQRERDGIVAWMRSTADMYARASDLVGDSYALTWHIIADLIEQKADKKQRGPK